MRLAIAAVLGCLGLLLALYPPPVEAGATVTEIGKTTGTSSSPYHISLTAGCSAGGGIVIAAGKDSNTTITYTVTDNTTGGPNTYQTDANQADGDYVAAALISAYVAHAFTASNTITITPSVDGHLNFIVLCVSTMASSSWLDAHRTDDITSGTTNPTSGSLAPASSPTVAIAAFHCDLCSAFSAYGNIIGSAATGIDNVAFDSRILAVQWRELSSTTGGTTNLNWSGSVDDTVIAFATYKEGSGGGGGGSPHSLPAMGCCGLLRSASQAPGAPAAEGATRTTRPAPPSIPPVER